MAGEGLAILVLLALCHQATSLECYECINMEIHSDNAFVEAVIGGNTDPHCADLGHYVATTACPMESVCGFTEGTVSGAVPLTGQRVQIKVQVRGCMPDMGWGYAQGCEEVSDVTKDGLNLGLALLTELGDVQVESARECYCTTDLCDAGGCTSGQVYIDFLEFCADWWMIAFAVVGAIIAVLLLTCCCCCCCCTCCRKNRKHGQVILYNQPTPTNTVVQASTVGGIHAVENPSYSYLKSDQKSTELQVMA